MSSETNSPHRGKGDDHGHASPESEAPDRPLSEVREPLDPADRIPKSLPPVQESQLVGTQEAQADDLIIGGWRPTMDGRKLQWIKLAIDFLDDDKVKIIEAMPEGDSILLIWIKLLCLAGKANAGGVLLISKDIPYNADMIAHRLNRDPGKVRYALDTFARLGMISFNEEIIQIANWEKHQKLGIAQDQKKLRANRNRKHYLTQKEKDGNLSARERSELEKLRRNKALPSPGQSGDSDVLETSDGCLNGVLPPSYKTPIDRDVDLDISSSNEEEGAPGSKKPKIPLCPVNEIASLYTEILPSLPQPKRQAGKITGKTITAQIRQRWRDGAERRDLSWWRDYFTSIKARPFLMGEVKDFVADLEWITRPKNMEKILNGRFRDSRRPGTAGSKAEGSKGNHAAQVGSADHSRPKKKIVRY